MKIKTGYRHFAMSFSRSGFTLSELLISLLILGVIATMAIPKILFTSQSNQYNAITREDVSAVDSAFYAYRQQNGIKATTKMDDIIPYLNYVRVDSTSNVDQPGSISGCGGAIPAGNCGTAPFVCYQMHNGSILWYDTFLQFNGTGSTNALEFFVDPNGHYDNTGAAYLFIYPNGRVTTRGHTDPNTTNNENTYAAPDTTADPDWLVWK